MSQNRYEVLGKIADGGLGSVYKAYDRNLRREVALKRVRAETQEEIDKQAEQLFEEARTLSTLQHPHIVTIFDVGKDEEGAYIVMELLKGETLEDIIARGALNEYDFRELVTQSLEGMIAAHASGLIHLDIKPQNFMVIWLPSGKFQIKILDFGLAKITSQPTVQETDEDGAIMGSIYFMSPEQFERSPVDARTDLYALGCVYYYALTQHYPFQGETGPEVMASHMYHSLIPLSQLRPDLPPFIHLWIEWLISRLPDHRPQSASEAFEAFKAGQFPETLVIPEPVIPAPSTSSVPVATASGSQPTAPRPSRPGSTTGPLRPVAPRPTRPVPTITRPVQVGKLPGGKTQAIGGKTAPKPLAKPINIAAAAAPKHLKTSKSLPKWLTLGVPLGVALLVALIFGFQAMQSSKREARLNQLAQMNPPQGTIMDVNMLVAMLDDPEKSERAGSVLGKIEGVSAIEGSLSRAADRVSLNWAQKNLAIAISQRGVHDAVPGLIKQLGNAKEADTRNALWSALGKSAQIADVPDLLGVLARVSSEELRTAEFAILNACRSESDAKMRPAPVLQALRSNSGSDDVQAVLLRILGKLGGKDSLDELNKGLKSENLKIRNAAVTALGEWSNGVPLKSLLDLLSKEKSTSVRLSLFNAIGLLAAQSGDLPQQDISSALISTYSQTKDAREQLQIITLLGRVVDEGAIAFLQGIGAADAKRKQVADAALKSINDDLARVLTITDDGPLDIEKAVFTSGPLTRKDGVIINWLGMGDHVGWILKFEKAGIFEIKLSQSFSASTEGRYTLTLGKELFARSVDKTSSPTDFKTVTVGKATISKPGVYRLWIRPLEIARSESLMRLKEVSLTAAKN
jgi:serine/threonine protein kinase/HEAT repeat protein